MGRYLKLFENYQDYIQYCNNDEFILPNVSCVINDNKPKYMKHVIVIYNVIDDTEETKLYAYYKGYTDAKVNIERIIIDGKRVDTGVLDDNNGYYMLSLGTHIVEYVFKDRTEIISWMFDRCYEITSVRMPDYIEEIGQYAFQSCESLTSFKFSNRLRTIKTECFKWNPLSSCVFPESLTTIERVNFSDCTFDSIVIPENVTSIGDTCFVGCTNLNAVILRATVPPLLGENSFNGRAANCKFYVPAASINAYRAAAGWSEFSNDIYAINE